MLCNKYVYDVHVCDVYVIKIKFKIAIRIIFKNKNWVSTIGFNDKMKIIV